MPRGGRAGVGGRGGPAAKEGGPDAIGGSWEYFRERSDRVFMWGQTGPGSNVGISSTALSTADPNGPNNLRAYPHIFPRGGTIGRMGWFNPIVYGGGGGALRFGIYSDNGNGFPDQLVVDSGAFTSWPDPAGAQLQRWRAFNANVAVEPMSVLWLAWIYNDALRAAGQSVYTWNTNEMSGMLGYFDPEVVEPNDNAGAGGRIPGTASAHIGWRVPQAYGPLPQTFPSANSRAIAMNNATLEPSTLDGRVFATAFKWTADD